MTAFAVAAALHAGFSLTVTLLVYPALVEVPRESWEQAHGRHSRRITPLVGVVYLALLATGAVLVAEGPRALGWVAVVATAGALVVTATAAAPLHGRLDATTDDLRRRLLVVDRLRTTLAVAGLLAAVLDLVQR